MIETNRLIRKSLKRNGLKSGFCFIGKLLSFTFKELVFLILNKKLYILYFKKIERLAITNNL